MNIELRVNSKIVNYEYHFLIDMESAMGFVKINMTIAILIIGEMPHSFVFAARARIIAVGLPMSWSMR